MTPTAKHRAGFKWLKPELFDEDLAMDLRKDARALLKVLKTPAAGMPSRDAKLARP